MMVWGVKVGRGWGLGGGEEWDQRAGRLVIKVFFHFCCTSLYMYSRQKWIKNHEVILHFYKHLHDWWGVERQCNV